MKYIIFLFVIIFIIYHCRKKNAIPVPISVSKTLKINTKPIINNVIASKTSKTINRSGLGISGIAFNQTTKAGAIALEKIQDAQYKAFNKAIKPIVTLGPSGLSQWDTLLAEGKNLFQPFEVQQYDSAPDTNDNPGGSNVLTIANNFR